MIRSSVIYDGKAEEFVVDAGWEGLRRAAFFYWERLQQALNVPNPGKRVRRTRNTSGGPKGSSYTTYPSPSLPGEPPRKRTGFLQANVTYKLDEPALTARVGVLANAEYGLYLEVGTKKMAARPWLLATLKKYWLQITVLAGGNP